MQRYPLLDQFPAPLIPPNALRCGGYCPSSGFFSGADFLVHLVHLLAFLFISLSLGCKCDTKGTISRIAECQQVGLLLSASRRLRAWAVLGLFQLRLSQQLLEGPVLTLSSQRLHHNLGLHENTGLRPAIN